MSALSDWRPVSIGDGVLEVRDGGAGPPLVMIGTALVADRLVPLAEACATGGDHRVTAYRLRGYGRSSPVAEAGATRTAGGGVADDVRDCIALLDALGLAKATLVGFAYSAAVALQVAREAADRVERLCLIEPLPMQADCSHEYRTANAELLAEFEAIGAWPAADRYLWRLMGRGWQRTLDEALPGVVERIRADAETFFTATLPHLMAWSFSPDDAARVTVPTLLVTGGSSVHWFTEEVGALQAGLPHATHAVIRGASHSLLITHPQPVADALRAFLTPGRTPPIPSQA